LSRQLAREAEAVCKYYLSNGSRSGRYWLVGDAENMPGRSLFVRLTGPDTGRGAAGKWQDAATGEHGDLLDLIAANRGLSSLAEALAEARAFLRIPDRQPAARKRQPARSTTESARRLWASAVPISGTLAETYLRKRAIATTGDLSTLRFHPRCYWISADGHSRRALPAMLAAVTDIRGKFTGLQRTWLASDGTKANIDPPRRALGNLLGNAVRFGEISDSVVVAEGIETALSIRTVLPSVPAYAALSAAHLQQIEFHPNLRLLVIAQDNDEAGRSSANVLAARAVLAGIQVLRALPHGADWNDDLVQYGPDATRRSLPL
jgi:phage/plasmid primase-like uncharacterized protein